MHFTGDRSLESSYPGFAIPAAPTKPFANARPFASGVSPYMGLFRNDTNGGTIDNYSTLVRPALDQRSMNQQFNLDIYGLERNARLQNRALQDIDRYNQSRSHRKASAHRSFTGSFGGYYPDLARPGSRVTGSRASSGRQDHVGKHVLPQRFH